MQNEVTKLKSLTAAPSTEEIGNSEEDRQNLIQVVKMASVNVSLLEALLNPSPNMGLTSGGCKYWNMGEKYVLKLKAGKFKYVWINAVGYSTATEAGNISHPIIV